MADLRLRIRAENQASAPIQNLKREVTDLGAEVRKAGTSGNAATVSIDKLGDQAQQAAGQFDRFGDEVKQSGDRLRDARSRFVSTGQGATKFGGQVGGAGKGVSRLSGLLGGLGGVLGALGLASVTSQIGEFATSSVRAAAQLEGFERGLEIVEGSAGAADQRLQELIEVARLPGLNLPDLIKFSNSLRVMGLTAEETDLILQSTGQAILSMGGTAFTAAEVVTQLTQAIAANAVSLQDFRSIAQRVPDFYMIVADVHGVAANIDGLREAVDRAGGSIKDTLLPVMAELAERYESPPEDSYVVAVDALQNSFLLLQAAIGDQLLPVVARAANELSVLFDGLREGTLEIPEPLREIFDRVQALATALFDLGRRVFEYVLPYVQRFYEGIGELASSILNLAQKILPLLAPLFEIVKVSIAATYEIVGQLASALADVINGIASVVDWLTFWESAEKDVTASTEELAKSVDVAEAAIRTVSTTFSDTMKATEAYEAAIKALSSEFDENEKSITRLTASQQRHLDAGGVKAASAYQVTEKQLNNLRARQDELTSALDVTTQKLGETTGALMTAGGAAEGAGDASGNYQLRLAMLTAEAEDAREVLSNTIDAAQVSANFQMAADASDAYYQAQIDNAETALAREVEGSEEAQKLEVDLFNLRREQQEARADLYQEASEVFIEEENRQAKEAERVAEVREQVAEQTAKNIQQSQEETLEAQSQSIEDFNTRYEELTKEREAAEQTANENIVRLSESALSEIEDRFKNALPDAVAEAYQAVQSATVQHYETLKDQARQRITDEDELSAELTLLDTQRNATLRENHREYLSQLASDAKELLGERTEAFESASSDILSDWDLKIRGFEDRLKDVDTQEGLDTLRSDFDTAQDDMLMSLEGVLEELGFSATEIATIMQGFYQDAEQEASRFQGKVGDVQEEVTEGNVAIQTSSDAAAAALRRIGVETEDDLKNADENTKDLAESILEVQESIDSGLILSIGDLSIALDNELIPGLTSTEAALQKAFVDTLPYLDTFLQGIQDLGTEIGFLGEETADAVSSLQDVFSAISTGDVLGFFTSIPGLVRSLNSLTVEGFEVFGRLESLTDLSGQIGDTDELTSAQQSVLQSSIDNIINEIAVRTIEGAGPEFFNAINQQITSFLSEMGVDFDFDEAIESLEQLGVLTNDYNEAVGDTTIEFVKGFEDALDAGFGIPDLLENFDLFVNQPVTIGRPNLGGRTTGGGVAGTGTTGTTDPLQPLNDIFAEALSQLGFDPENFRLDTLTGNIVSFQEEVVDLVTMLGSGIEQVAAATGYSVDQIQDALSQTEQDVPAATDEVLRSVFRFSAEQNATLGVIRGSIEEGEDAFRVLGEGSSLQDVIGAYQKLTDAEQEFSNQQLSFINDGVDTFTDQALETARADVANDLRGTAFDANQRLERALAEIGLQLSDGIDETTGILSGTGLAVQSIAQEVETSTTEIETAADEVSQTTSSVVEAVDESLKSVFRFTQEQRDALSASTGNITRAENQIRALGDDATAEQVISAYQGLRDAEQSYYTEQLQFIDAGIGTFTDDALSNARVRIADELEDTAFDANQRLIKQLEEIGFTLTASVSATSGFLDNTTLGFERISEIVEPATQDINNATEGVISAVDQALLSAFRFTQEQRDTLTTYSGSITRAENEIKALGDDATAEQVISAYQGLREAEQEYSEQQLQFIESGVGVFTDDALSNARVRVADDLEDTAFDANQRLIKQLEDLGFTLTASISATTGFLSDTALTIEAIPEEVENATGEVEQTAEEVVESVQDALRSVFRFTQEQNDVLKTLAGQITTAENTVRTLGDDSSVPQVILAYRALRDAETGYYAQQLDFIDAGIGTFSDESLARARTRAADQLNDTAFDANRRFLSQLEELGLTLSTSINATTGFLSDAALAFMEIPDIVEPVSDDIDTAVTDVSQSAGQVADAVEEALRSVFRFTQEQRDTLTTFSGNITRAENAIKALGEDAAAEQVISAYQGLRSAEQEYNAQQLQFINTGVGIFTDESLSNARVRVANDLEDTAFDANQRLIRQLEDLGFMLTTSITATSGFLSDTALAFEQIPQDVEPAADQIVGTAEDVAQSAEEVIEVVDEVLKTVFRFTQEQRDTLSTLAGNITNAENEVRSLGDESTAEQVIDAYQELRDAETQYHDQQLAFVDSGVGTFTDDALENARTRVANSLRDTAFDANRSLERSLENIGLSLTSSFNSVTGFLSDTAITIEQIPQDVEAEVAPVDTVAADIGTAAADVASSVFNFTQEQRAVLGNLQTNIVSAENAFRALGDDSELPDVIRAYQLLTDAEQAYTAQQLQFVTEGVDTYTDAALTVAQSTIAGDFQNNIFGANQRLVGALEDIGFEVVGTIDETTGVLEDVASQVAEVGSDIIASAEAAIAQINTPLIRNQIERLRFDLGGAFSGAEFEDIRGDLVSSINEFYQTAANEIQAGDTTGAALQNQLEDLQLGRRRELLGVAGLTNEFTEIDEAFAQDAIRIAQELEAELADIESQSFTRRVEMVQDQVEVVQESAEEQVAIVEDTSGEILAIDSELAEERAQIEEQLADTLRDIDDQILEDQARAARQQSDRLTDIDGRYAERIEDIREGLQDTLADIAQDELNIERDKLESIEQLNIDHAESLEDIKQRSTRRIEDIELDLQRRIEDINRDAAEEIAGLEDDPSLGARTNARRRQQAIADIRREAQQSITEAQRRAGRSREDVAITETRSIDDLEEQRVENLAELERRAIEQREDLQDTRSRARSDALTAEFEAQQDAHDARQAARATASQAHAQALADAEDARVRARQDADLAHERAIADAEDARISTQNSAIESQQSSIDSAASNRQTERQSREVVHVEDLEARRNAQAVARRNAQEAFAELQRQRDEAIAEKQAQAALVRQTQREDAADIRQVLRDDTLDMRNEMRESMTDERQDMRNQELIAEVSNSQDIQDSRQEFRITSFLDSIAMAEDIQDTGHNMRVTSLLNAAMQIQDAFAVASMIPPIEVQHSFLEQSGSIPAGRTPGNNAPIQIDLSVDASRRIGDSEIKAIQRETIRVDDQGRIG